MLDALEERVAAHIAASEDELAGLLQQLVRFDSVESGGQLAALQGHLAALLGEHGAEIALGEPDPELVAGHPYVPEGFDFAGRPQLVARFPGGGGGRSLLLTATSTSSPPTRARPGRRTRSAGSAATAGCTAAAPAT